MHKNLFFILLIILSSCSTNNIKVEIATSFVVNLVESTSLIRTLICTNKLSGLLEEHDEAQLLRLINNVSPAHMAFEFEIFSTTVPMVVVYYYIDSVDEQSFIDQLNILSEEYDNHIKFVIIEANQLFVLAQDAEIVKFPTILVMKNKKLIDRIEDVITIDLLKEKLLFLNGYY